jgi:Fis family transcriptional regulator
LGRCKCNTDVERRRVRGENVVTKASNRSSRKKTPKKKSGKTVKVGVKNKPLSTLTGEALNGYFSHLNGHKPGDLYELVLGEVEKPLFRTVLEYTNGNQSEAAEILGINRGTLRKKLRNYNLIT